MKKSSKKNNEIVLLDKNNWFEIDNFGAVLNCAIRYCLGRRTYMPELATRFIMDHCENILTKKTLSVMIDDIEQCGDFGDKCDEETWMNFLFWVKNEYAKVKDKEEI